MRLGRLAVSEIASDTVFVFVVAAKRNGESYEEYRRRRMAVLHAYVETAKLKSPAGTKFVGIAFDDPHKDYQGGSEDLFVLIRETWTPEDLAELERQRKDLGLWAERAAWSTGATVRTSSLWLLNETQCCAFRTKRHKPRFVRSNGLTGERRTRTSGKCRRSRSAEKVSQESRD